jgi:hypothetical protein
VGRRAPRKTQANDTMLECNSPLFFPTPESGIYSRHYMGLIYGPGHMGNTHILQQLEVHVSVANDVVFTGVTNICSPVQF